MPPSPIPLPVGRKVARDAAHKAWLTLAAAALLPMLAVARVVPAFFMSGSPVPLSDNAPNVWAVVGALPWIGDLPLAGLAMAMAIGAAAWLAAYFSARPPRSEASLPAALLVALVVPGLAPGMRPDDFLLAVALSFALAVKRRDERVAGLVMAGYLLTATGVPILGSAAMIAATALITRRFLILPANDNGLPLNQVMPYLAGPALLLGSSANRES